MAQDAKILQWFLGLQAFIQSREEFRPLAPFITVPESELQNPEALRIAHIKASLNTLYSKEYEELSVRAVDAYAREYHRAQTVYEDKFLEAEHHVSQLKEQGFSVLPTLEPDVVAAMRGYFEAQPIYASLNEPSYTAIPFSEAQTSLNLAHFKEADILNCPHLMDIALDPLRLGVAQQFLGTVPMIITTAAWWSFAQADQAKDAQLYHLDLDDYRFVKFFIYLTDVDHDAGPHAFVPTTHRCDTLLKAREAASSPQEFDRWLGQLRKTDEEVDNAFGIEPALITGNAGTTFMANTRGIHKGLLPKTKNRLICQIVYGVTPQRIRKDLPVDWSAQATGNIKHTYVTPPFDYITQLYLRDPSA